MVDAIVSPICSRVILFSDIFGFELAGNFFVEFRPDAQVLYLIKMI